MARRLADLALAGLSRTVPGQARDVPLSKALVKAEEAPRRGPFPIEGQELTNDHSQSSHGPGFSEPVRSKVRYHPARSWFGIAREISQCQTSDLTCPAWPTLGRPEPTWYRQLQLGPKSLEPGHSLPSKASWSGPHRGRARASEFQSDTDKASKG